MSDAIHLCEFAYFQIRTARAELQVAEVRLKQQALVLLKQWMQEAQQHHDAVIGAAYQLLLNETPLSAYAIDL